MNRKIIGIVGSLNSEVFGVTSNYMEFANKYGDVRIIMPWEPLVKVDLLILPGGLDIRQDNQIPSYKNSNTDVFKQYFYDKKLSEYINAGTPIFGICLGMQMLATYFDSKLTQNIVKHPQSKERWATAHTVDGRNKSLKNKGLSAVYNMKVNSHHHQAITVEGISKKLVVLTVSSEVTYPNLDIVESFIHRDKPIAGVQWHPEELYDSHSDDLIKKLLWHS